MTTGDHEEFRDWSGAYTFGALEPDDRRAFERHLVACSICSEEVRSFAPIPGLLAQTEQSEVDDWSNAETAAAISLRVRQADLQLQQSRKRWRAAALITTAAAILLLAGLVAVDFGSESETPSSATNVAIVTLSQAESSAVLTSARGWGTEIQVELTGLPERDEYQLWAVARDGTWSAAATWGPTSSGGARVTGATSLPTHSLVRVVVTSRDRTDVLIDAST